MKFVNVEEHIYFENSISTNKYLFNLKLDTFRNNYNSQSWILDYYFNYAKTMQYTTKKNVNSPDFPSRKFGPLQYIYIYICSVGLCVNTIVVIICYGIKCVFFIFIPF